MGLVGNSGSRILYRTWRIENRVFAVPSMSADISSKDVDGSGLDPSGDTSMIIDRDRRNAQNE